MSYALPTPFGLNPVEGHATTLTALRLRSVRTEFGTRFMSFDFAQDERIGFSHV